MRLDHIAYRVADKSKTAQFFINAFGYKVQTTFNLVFEDGSKTECIALEPPEKIGSKLPFMAQINPPWMDESLIKIDYHLAPEIFVSDGDENSIVGQWVKQRDGVGGIHHLAYQVDSVENIMAEWRHKGYAEFTSKNVLKCEGLTQVFTKPSPLTGVIYEFINRTDYGFCSENVKELMLSTKGL